MEHLTKHTETKLKTSNLFHVDLGGESNLCVNPWMKFFENWGVHASLNNNISFNSPHNDNTVGFHNDIILELNHEFELYSQSNDYGNFKKSRHSSKTLWIHKKLNIIVTNSYDTLAYDNTDRYSIDIVGTVDDKIAITKITNSIIDICKKYNDMNKDLDKIYIIRKGTHGFDLNDFKIEKSNHHNELDFMDLYNDDFKDISTKILEDLKKDKNNGLVLLHGEMGTGKTSFLKHIINRVKDKKVIFLPLDLVEHLSSPDFVAFLAEQTNSIIIIEDAENILKHREAGGSQAVSNILNTSDGILGSVIKAQFVCTFNCDINNIDKALLRPGRLIGAYEFKRLSVDKTETLIYEIYKDHADEILNDPKWKNKELTLAEIFNLDHMPVRNTKDKTDVKFGFVPESI